MPSYIPTSRNVRAAPEPKPVDEDERNEDSEMKWDQGSVAGGLAMELVIASLLGGIPANCTGMTGKPTGDGGNGQSSNGEEPQGNTRQSGEFPLTKGNR